MGSICVGISKKCVNPLESYGEICVGCGCCSDNKSIRYPARLALWERELDRCLNFNNWRKGHIKLQRRNRKADMKYCRRRVGRYKYLVGTLYANDSI